jgi:integration host factor subunit beta
MTKAELVEEVARAAELNKRDAEVIVETVFDSIIGALHKGEKVELRGFGSFRTRERGPRRGRNPKTGEPVDVPAKRVPYFKPGKELKDFFTESPDDGASGAGEKQGAASPPSAADYPPGPSAGEESAETASAGGEGPAAQNEPPASNERSYGASPTADDATGTENSDGDRAGDEESAGGSKDGEGSPSGPGH